MGPRGLERVGALGLNDGEQRRVFRLCGTRLEIADADVAAAGDE